MVLGIVKWFTGEDDSSSVDDGVEEPQTGRGGRSVDERANHKEAKKKRQGDSEGIPQTVGTTKPRSGDDSKSHRGGRKTKREHPSNPTQESQNVDAKERPANAKQELHKVDPNARSGSASKQAGIGEGVIAEGTLGGGGTAEHSDKIQREDNVRRRAKADEVRIGEMSQEEQRRNITQLTEEIRSMSRKVKERDDKLSRSDQDLDSTRRELQTLRDHLSQFLGQGAVQRKGQSSDTAVKVEEWRQQSAQWTEERDSSGKNSKEDELSRVKQELISTRDQLQAQQDRSTQLESQSQLHRKQHEDQNSEMSRRLEEQQQLIAQLKEERDSSSKKAKEKEDELLRSKQDLTRTRERLQAQPDGLAQSQNQIEVQRKQYESEKSEMSRRLREQQQLIAQLKEERDSSSKKAKEKEDELLRSKRDLTRTREQLQAQPDGLTQSQNQVEAQRKQYESEKSEMSRKLEEQQRLIAQLTEERNSTSKKEKDELFRSRQDLTSTREQLQAQRDRLTQFQSQDEVRRKQYEEVSRRFEEQRQLVAQLKEEKNSMSRNAKEREDELSRSNQGLVNTRQHLQDQLAQLQHEHEVQRERQKSEMTGKLEEQRQRVAQLTEERDSLSKKSGAKEIELSRYKLDLVSTRQQLQELQDHPTQSQREGEAQRKQFENQKREMTGRLEAQQQLVDRLMKQSDSMSGKAKEREDELSRSNQDLVRTKKQLQDLQDQLTQSQREHEVQMERQKDEKTRRLEEERQLVAQLTEEKKLMSKKDKEKEDKLFRSDRDLVNTRQQLQNVQDQLTQSQRDCEVQRKLHNGQKSEMTGGLEDQRQLVAQLKEESNSKSKKVKEREDELSLSNRDLVRTKQQLQDLQGQLTQLQREHEVQMEHQKGEMTRRLEEQRQLVAQLTEEKKLTSKKEKEKEDKLSRSDQDLDNTRQQLQKVQDQLTQSQRERDVQTKLHEGQMTEMTGVSEDRRQLVVQLKEKSNSMSKKVKEKEDELSLSNRDLVRMKQQLQDLQGQPTQLQREHEVQVERQKSEMTGRLEEQRQLVVKLTKKSDSMSGKAKEGEDELSRSSRELERQLQTLRDRLAEPQGQGEIQRKQYVGHKTEVATRIEGQQRIVAQLTKDRDFAGAKAKEREDELVRMKEEQQRLIAQLVEERKQVEDLRNTDSQPRHVEAKATRAELHQLRIEHAQVQALLKTRTDELSGAYSFLDKADLLPAAEVTAMVDALNSEIFQTAASIVDSLQFRKVKAAARNQQNIAYERVRSELGPKMVFLLTSVPHAEDPMLLQFALQCRLVWDCKIVIESWGFGKFQDHLVEIYEGVRKTEHQAVSGRWRALTRGQIRSQRSGPDLTLQICKILANSLVDVLIVGGYRESSTEVFEMIWAKFSNSIKTITNLAFRLNQTIGEQVTSSDLEVMCVRGDVAFFPEDMEDIGGDYASTADRVLCTTDLGLQQGSREANGNRKKVLLLKPKVALESLMNE